MPLVDTYSFWEKEIEIPDDLSQKLFELQFLIVRSKYNASHYTGLVFVGFGELEIYPSLIPVMVSFSLGNRLRYHVEENTAAAISHEIGSAICPFAQVDVIDTILTGVEPRLKNAYRTNFINFLDQYNELLLRADDGQSNLTQLIQGINKKQLVDKYMDINNQLIHNNYISPLLDAVAGLSKEDLAEMAESLIYLTYLKRRMTNSEESVGGPVDVAILSKGDGFVWIKRKHYFKPELNNHFFNSYFNF